MPKILVADLFGTIIPNNILNANYLYGNIDKYKDINEICYDKNQHEYLIEKLCLQCANDLKKFLNDGNELIIASDLSAHELNLNFIYEEIIEKILKYCDKDFTLYMVTKGGAASFNLEELKSYITEEYSEHGIDYIVFEGYKIGLINRKEDIFKVVESKFNLQECELYSIGNDYKDIPMLVRCIELGGKSSLLNYNLYSNELLSRTTLDKAICERIQRENHILLEKELLKDHPGFSLLDKYKYLMERRLTSEYNRWYEKRKEELYQEVRKGNITLEQLIKEKLIFGLCQTAINHCLEKKTFIENNLDKIDMYSTFRDYYNKVLNCDFKEKIEKSPVKLLKP